MKKFAFFFRQSRQLSDSEQKQRTAEVVAWVKQQIAEGRKLEPRVLDSTHESVVSGEHRDDVSTNSGGALVAINFLEAKDFEEAVEIATTRCTRWQAKYDAQHSQSAGVSIRRFCRYALVTMSASRTGGTVRAGVKLLLYFFPPRRCLA